MWPQDERIIGQATAAGRARIVVDQLSCRRDLNGVRVERKLRFIADEVKQVRMGASELHRAVHTKRVVPAHPTAAVEPKLLSFELELSCILVTDC